MEKNDGVQKAPKANWAAVLVIIGWLVSVICAGLLYLWELIIILFYSDVPGEYERAMASREIYLRELPIFMVVVSVVAVIALIFLVARPSFLRKTER